MTGSSFSIVLYRGARTSHVVCRGELDVCAAAELEAVLSCSTDGSSRTVIFNGAGITLLTAEAALVLTETALLCRSRNVNFEVILGDRSWRVVELLGLAAVLSPAPLPEADYEIPVEVAEAFCNTPAPWGRNGACDRSYLKTGTTKSRVRDTGVTIPSRGRGTSPRGQGTPCP